MAGRNNNNPQNLIEEISDALKNVSYGSIEIYVQNKVVTQITVRNIKKTSVEIDEEKNEYTNGHNKREIRQKILIGKSQAD